MNRKTSGRLLLRLAAKEFQADCPDYEKAFAYFEEFAQEGNTRSMIVVAYMYQYGIGTQKDTDCAKKWIQKASNLGDQMATLILEGKASISDNSVIQQTLQ